ncbi:MAG: hypothetical protein HY672_04080 [Chloroflexi bacterium]|nr:hypothetical protein [Chloroflexota bacterium]
MPKTVAAQNIADIRNLRFSVDDGGTLQGLEMTVEVNYGSFGATETLDVLPKLSAAQRTAAQALYDRLKAILEEKFLA